MTLAQTYSWIFYAIGMASQNSAATQMGISQVADGINHAGPTPKEMQASVSWLLKKNLIKKDGKSIQLTALGKMLFEKGRSFSNTISGVWKKLTEEFAMMGADNIQQINPNNMRT